MKSWFFLPLALLLCLFLPGLTVAEEVAVLQGTVVDVFDKPALGAEVYVYDSEDVKRPGDFISTRTLADGHYRVAVPPGRYWLVARLRQGGVQIGPLHPDDKHSGSPQRVDLEAGAQEEIDFTVADLREISQRNSKKREDFFLVQGRLTDPDGKPLAQAYAMASSLAKPAGIAEYLSAWSEGDGKYVLYLPEGEFHIGASDRFPCDSCPLVQKISVAGNREGLDLVVPPAADGGKKK